MPTGMELQKLKKKSKLKQKQQFVVCRWNTKRKREFAFIRGNLRNEG
jgi:hypothetical protein